MAHDATSLGPASAGFLLLRLTLGNLGGIFPRMCMMTRLPSSRGGPACPLVEEFRPELFGIPDWTQILLWQPLLEDACGTAARR